MKQDIGDSIATVSNSVTQNGTKNTLIGASIFLVSTLAVGAGICGICILIENNKHKNATALENKKSNNKTERDIVAAQKAIEIDNQKTANKERLYRLRAELKTEASMKTDSLDTKNDVEPMRSFDDIRAKEDVTSEDLILMYSFLQKGGTLGVCGPTNIGKTTFLIQLLLNLTTGKCEYPLSATTYPTIPQKVLLFSTEQTDKEIRFSYGATTDRLPNFKIETEGTSPEEILAKIKLELSTAGDDGMVIAIDNYTKLREEYGAKKIRLLDRELSELQRENQNSKPVTIIKVFHTDKNYRDYQPIDIHHVKGSTNIINLTKNFIFLTNCRKGHDYRILKERKNKIAGTKETVSLLKYADTNPHQFVYDGEAIEEDVLPLNPARTNISTSGEVTKPNSRRGPKERFSEAELLEIWKEKEAGFSWKDILESRGIKYHKNKPKGILKALRRHNIIPPKEALR